MVNLPVPNSVGKRARVDSVKSQIQGLKRVAELNPDLISIIQPLSTAQL
jgi:hypothetical protein